MTDQPLCVACGTPLPPGAMFCGECGRAVASGVSSGLAPHPPAAPKVTEAPTTPTGAPAATEMIEPPPRAVLGRVAVPSDPLADLDDRAVTSRRERAEEPADVDQREPDREHVTPPERCSQCGAVLDSGDIFCPECGHVAASVGQNFRDHADARHRDTAVIEPIVVEPVVVEPIVVEPIAVEPVASKPVAAEPALMPHSDHDPDEDIEETRIVASRGLGDRFVLQFSTGESVTTRGSGLVGRNPLPEPGEYFEQLVRIIDPTRSVSKTHLEFGQESGAFWLRDRYSGNGTVVREPDSQPTRCDPGKRYRVLRGTRVDIGEQFFVIS